MPVQDVDRLSHPRDRRAHPRRPLCQDLESMPARNRHHGKHFVDPLVRNALMEKVAMGADEDVPRSLPFWGLAKPLLIKPTLSGPHGASLAWRRQAGAGGVGAKAGAGKLHRITI